MSDRDILVSSTTVPKVGALTKKPCYLIKLDSKSFDSKSFIALDKPESVNGFVTTKGFFCDKTEKAIINNYSDIISETSKENLLEILFPIDKIIYIRSLVFNAK